MQDQPLHPNPDLVADILGQRPDVISGSGSTSGNTGSSTGSEGSRPRPEENNPWRPPVQLPSISENGGQSPLTPVVPCGGPVIAKINEVDTLFSPGI